MGTPTKYSSLTDFELLFKVDEARTKSPIIEELARRLESRPVASLHDINNFEALCPSCETVLRVRVSQTGDDFELKAQ